MSRLLVLEADGVSQGETAPGALARLYAEFIRQLRTAYQSVLALDGEAERFANIWDFPDCARYLEELGQWLEPLCG